MGTPRIIGARFKATDESATFDGQLDVTSGNGIGINGTEVISSSRTLENIVSGSGSFYEGPTSFTAGVTFGGGSTGITYTLNVSTAVKLGKAVFFSISIALSNKGSSTGTALITGLPYTSSSTSNLFSSVNLYGGDFTFADYPQAYVDNNATTIMLTEVTNAGTATVLTSSDFTNTTTLYLTGMYFTD